jgi:transaldolase
MTSPLEQLSDQGVSIWLDDISRERLRSGNLQQLIDSKHVVGVTSNPTIFQKALEKGDAYDEQLRELKRREIDGDNAIRYLMAYDIRWACDVLRPLFDATDGKDGRVSIEVDPRMAHDQDKTAAEAKGLWWLVDRPNVMIKDPAYDDTMYVVQLVAPNTVNTMPEATLDAVADHGKVAGDAIAGSYDDARQVIDALNAIGVEYDDVIEALEVEGVQKFEDSYAQLADSVKEQLAGIEA